MRKSAAHKRKKRSLYVKRRNKRVKSALLVAGSLTLLALFFVIKSLVTPAVSAFSSTSNDLKDKDIYSVLLVEKEGKEVIKTINLLIVQRADNKLYSISIPAYTKVDLPGRLGVEEIAKTMQIASSVGEEVETPDLLTETVKKLSKINVDRYWIADTEVFDVIQGALFNKEIGVFLPWELKNITQKSQTNLNPVEILELVSFTRKLDGRGIESMELTQIADLDLKLRDISLGTPVAQESLSVVILNGTGVENIGREVSLVAQNMGSRISLVANAENEYQNSYLVTDDPLSPTVTYLKKYFPDINIINKSAAGSLGENLLERGDISLIIGFDILEQLQ